MRFQLSLGLDVNVTVRTRDRQGRIVEEVKEHNVTLNVGRSFLRDSLCCDRFPLQSYEPPTLPPPSLTTGLAAYAVNNHKPMYVAVGTGGIFQTHSYPGPGSRVSVATVRGLERPLPVAANMALPEAPGLGGFRQYGRFWQWMKQIEPQDLTDPAQAQDPYTVTFRCLFAEGELAFPGQAGDYGLVMPVSEFLLLTSAADPYLAPTSTANGQYQVLKANRLPFEWTPPGSGASQNYFDCYTDQDVVGALAYDISVPISVTPNVSLEVLWEMRS